ncbi:hypothetical protein E2C01_063234 [Portunus trituberculatus]|uniref:Uncharacterized protein n=1 Tax=Portunus trituberculatus TaxID=210409 RepID=A0A5B7H8M9_PORTR|nr:hypothetical protein [Portunus trituberculatus]
MSGGWAHHNLAAPPTYTPDEVKTQTTRCNTTLQSPQPQTNLKPRQTLFDSRDKKSTNNHQHN